MLLQKLLTKILICICFIFAFSTAFASENVIKIGVLVLNDKQETLSRWAATADYLTSEIKPFKFEILPLSFDEIRTAVKNKQVDYLITNPAMFVEFEYLYQTTRLLTLKRIHNGKEFYTLGSVIFTKSNRTDLNTLQDLKGNIISAVSANSLGGWLIALREFKTNGIEPERDFTAVKFLNSHAKVLEAVMRGDADAGIVRTGIIEDLVEAGTLSLRDIKVINQRQEEGFPKLLSSRLYPEWPFSALKHADKDLSNKIVVALLSLSPQSKPAVSAGTAGWSIPLDYYPVHELLKELRIGIYENYGKITVVEFVKMRWGMFLTILGLLCGLFVFAMYVATLNNKLNAANRDLNNEIAQNKLISDKLKESNDFLQTILQSLKDSIAVIDVRDFKIVSVNKAFAEEMDLTEAQVLGKECFKVTHQLTQICQAPEHKCPLFETLQTKDISTAEHIHRSSNGKEFYVEVSTSPIFDSDGNITKVVHISRDITSRKLYELELKKSKEIAELASAAKSRFLANISHEIRTPMNAIINMTDMVLDTELTASQRQNLTIVKEASQSLLLLLNDILDLSRIEAGKLSLDVKPFSLRELANTVTALFTAQAMSKSIALTCYVDSSIPDILIGDDLRLRQVLSNLLGNAIKFTESGTVAFKITSQGVSEGQAHVTFEVVDTGIGIEQSQLDKIFGSFVQADDSLTRKYGGSGLGLTISSEIIKLMGSRIEVQSELGKGSRFYFTLTLPIATEPLTKQSSLIEPIKPVKTASLLVVEDNPINQNIAVKVLSKIGHSVDVANNGQEALQMLKAKQYDLVLMDIQMPVMDGLTATEAIRQAQAGQANTNIPIIAMTAHALQDDKIRCLQAGMNDYITKPINVQELYSVISKYL